MKSVLDKAIHCAGCNIVFSYEEEDYELESDFSTSVYSSNRYFISCPKCRHETTIIRFKVVDKDQL